MPVIQANTQDAVNVKDVKIVVNGEQWGFATGLTIDGSSPEDIINCIGGTIRRIKPATFDWSLEMVTLYNNLGDIKALADGAIFQIIVEMNNSVKTDSENLGQVITVQDCRVNAHSITVNDASTCKMSGKAKGWEVAPLV